MKFSVYFIVLVLFGTMAEAATKGFQRSYYRYVDENGVRVINHQIPPEYAQKGYEIVTLHGEVIRVVEPAPTEEEAEEAERLRKHKMKLEEWDAELRRRYSTVADIEAAKKRKLDQVETSIKILESNIYSLKVQIANQHAAAAENERQGKEVPKSLLKTLVGLEEELKLTQEQLTHRHAQYVEFNEKYEKDKQRFQIIRPDGE